MPASAAQTPQTQSQPPASSTTTPPPQPVVIAPSPVSQPDVRPTAAVVPTQTANATANAGAEIGAVIDAYARAIESRDIGELRRVYAAITADQARAFSDFFASTRTLRATLSVKNLRVDGATATASVSGIYEFTTTSGRAQQQAVNFQTELRRDGAAWKLTAVR